MRIQFNIGNYLFSASWFFTLSAAVITVSMCGLAYWQYSRAQEKIAMQTKFAQSIAAPAVPLTEIHLTEPDQRYRHVSVHGHYDNHHQILLDNQMHQGMAGYLVLTPLLQASGEAILVQRGWVAQTTDRRQLPDINIDEQPRTLYGYIEFPSSPFKLGTTHLEGSWPLRTPYFDAETLEQLQTQMPMPLQEAIIILKDSEDLLNTWQPVAKGPEINYAYMLQWLAMAITVLILYIKLNIRRREHDASTRS